MEEMPKARGGRRSKRPKNTSPKCVTEIQKQNLRPGWKPGEPGNPSWRPKSLVEITKLASELTPAAILRLHKIAHDPESLDRDKIAACIAIADRGCGRPPVVGVFHHGSSDPMLSGAPDGNEEMSGLPALLARARLENQKADAERGERLAKQAKAKQPNG